MLAQPNTIIDALPIHEGDTVIDCGAGIGSYAFLLAEKVGRHGHVHAFDIQPGLVATLARDAVEHELHHITALTVDLDRESMPLQDASVDGAIVAHVLFQLGDKKHCIQEIARVLKPGGWCAVIEWRDSFQGIGPQLDYIVPEEQVHTLCDDAGLLYVRSLTVGTFEYGVLFQKI